MSPDINKNGQISEGDNARQHSSGSCPEQALSKSDSSRQDRTKLDQAIREKLKVLHEDYGRQLPIKIAQLRELWQDFEKKRDGGTLMLLERTVHSLTGSGATYGFPTISNAARKLETQLREIIKSGNNLVNEEIACLLNSLLQVLLEAHESVIFTNTM